MLKEDTQRPSRLRDLARSWWVGLTLLWWLNWTAFVYIGLKAHRRRWLVAAAVYSRPAARERARGVGLSQTFIAPRPGAARRRRSAREG